jgi:uncharacterized protein GlcG (DUF336 family)
MLEHVRSTRAWKARLQDLLQPAWTRITGGCHPNRHTERAVEAAGFRIEDDGRRARGDMRRFAARPSVREPPGRPGRLVPNVLPSADPPPSPTEEEGMTRQGLLALAVGTALVFTAATAGAQAPPPPPYGAPITLEQAKKIMAGAEAESKKNSWGMVITILDSGGNPVMMQRMDGTQLGSVEVARDKAWSAVAFRRPTKVFEDLVAQGGANLRILKLSGANPIEGGIPIVVDGKIIGAVGVSGGSAAQDGQVAKAGIDALK